MFANILRTILAVVSLGPFRLAVFFFLLGYFQFLILQVFKITGFPGKQVSSCSRCILDVDFFRLSILNAYVFRLLFQIIFEAFSLCERIHRIYALSKRIKR